MDGEYIPAHPAQLVLDGRHAQVDIMSGVTRDEGALFALRKVLKYNVIMVYVVSFMCMYAKVYICIHSKLYYYLFITY